MSFYIRSLVVHMQLTGVFAALGNRDVSAAPGLGMRLTEGQTT